MIITLLSGGIGNQFFQYAVGKNLANKLHTELKLDVIRSTLGDNSFRLQNFNIEADLATSEEVNYVKEKIKQFSQNPGKEKYDDVPIWRVPFQSEILSLPDNSYLEGCFHSQRYFEDVSDILRKEFTYKRPLGLQASEWKEKILAADCSVAVHFRNFAYTYPLEKHGRLSAKYYADCINELKKLFKNLTLFVFSNDMDCARKRLSLDESFQFVQGCTVEEDLVLMSLCKHNIMSNSTFSWWGAWLNKNPDKKVFAPKPFYRLYYVADMIPKEWIQISAEFEKNLTPPALSIVVHVEKGFSELEKCLNSIENQLFKNYEVILICDTDVAKEELDLCKDFIAEKNDAVLIRRNRKISKYSAWNIGIDVSCGDHIMFITSKDSVKIKAVRAICSVVLRVRLMFQSSSDFITQTEDFSNADVAADIVNSVDSSLIPELSDLLKNVNSMYQGDAGISHCKYKKPFVSVDSRLKFLKSGGMNSSIKTKFFKRNFLQHENIRFNEKMSDSAEMIFLTDCMLKTDDVMFISHSFVE